MTVESNNPCRIKHILVLTALSVLALAISACFVACTPTDEKPAGPPEKVTVANIVPPFTVLVDIAQVNGYYKQEGLDVAMQKHPYGQIALRALLEGKADFATVAETPVIFEIMRGQQIAIIATIQTSSKNNAIIARKDRGISAPGDLKGRKIAATFGTISEFFMDSFLVVNGISRKNVEAINLTPDQMMGSLTNGDVDAVSTWIPPLIGLQKKLGDRAIVFHNEEIYRQTINIVARQEYIRRKPGNVRKILRALIEAEEFAKQNPAEAQKLVALFNGMDEGILSDTWSGNAFRVTLDQSLVLALEDESRWAIKGGMTKAKEIPNYLDFIYVDGLKSVKPEALMILR